MSNVDVQAERDRLNELARFALSGDLDDDHVIARPPAIAMSQVDAERRAVGQLARFALGQGDTEDLIMFREEEN